MNPGDKDIELQQSSDSAFTSASVRYFGRDTGSVLTGLAEGSHFFRIRAVESQEWSQPIEIRVEFLAQSRLYLLLGLGGVVVIATISTIIAGHFMTREEQGG